MPTLTECHQISEEGNEKLKKLQDAILTGKAVVEMTESNGNVKYANESLNDYVVPLLKELKLGHFGYTAWRISTRIPIANKTGPEYIIPINKISGDPCLLPGGSLDPGTYIYHDGTGELLPTLVYLFVGRPR
ncbi:hypothetical protein I7I50_04638 [Histoplasma capsulatum G186AR]|nr:hypothetical protein I7I50_04638 [Histoplasma capsulatum G186AR]